MYWSLWETFSASLVTYTIGLTSATLWHWLGLGALAVSQSVCDCSTGSCNYYPPWKYLILYTAITCFENVGCHPFSSLLSFQLWVQSVLQNVLTYMNYGYFRREHMKDKQSCLQRSVRTYWQSHSKLQRRGKKTTVICSKSRYQKNSWVLWEEWICDYESKSPNDEAGARI